MKEHEEMESRTGADWMTNMNDDNGILTYIFYKIRKHMKMLNRIFIGNINYVER